MFTCVMLSDGALHLKGLIQTTNNPHWTVIKVFLVFTFLFTVESLYKE